MTAIIRPRPWTQQPQIVTGIDRSNPISDALFDAWSAHDGWRSASGQRPATVPSSAIRVATKYGVETKLNGSSSINTVFSGGINTGALPRTLMVFGHTGASSNSYDVFASIDTGNQALARLQVSSTNSAYSAYNGVSTPIGGTVVLSSRLVLTQTEIDHDTELFVNGGYVNGAAAAASNNLTASGVYIGGYIGQDAAWWDGSVSMVLVWNRKLSAKEIKSMYDNPWQIFRPRVT